MPGLDRVKAKLRSHAKAAIEAGVAEARRQAEIIAGLARTFAPAEDLDLIKSIRVEETDTATFNTKRGAVTVGFVGVIVKAGDATTVVVGAGGKKFQNAKLQEVGTLAMKNKKGGDGANPYFNPAKRMRKRAAKAAIGKAVREAWKAGS